MNEKERFLVVAEKGLCCSLLCPQSWLPTLRDVVLGD
jgi:hypothetical protein